MSGGPTDSPPAFAGHQWMRPPGFPRRLDIRATRAAEPRDGFRIYAPQRPTARLRYGIARWPLLRSRVFAREQPSWPLAELVERIGIKADHAVAMRSSSPGRWIVGLEYCHVLVAVAKCGPLHDVGLRREGDLLGVLGHADPWLRPPELLLAGEVGGNFAVVTQALPRRVGRASLMEMAEVATRLTNGALGRPLVHGDLAQWNAVRTRDRLWLVDWEHGRPERVPLWDLANHLCSEAVLLRRFGPRQVAAHLVNEGSVGCTHLRSVGENPLRARELVLAYLDGRTTSATTSEQRFELRLRRYLE